MDRCNQFSIVTQIFLITHRPRFSQYLKKTLEFLSFSFKMTIQSYSSAYVPLSTLTLGFAVLPFRQTHNKINTQLFMGKVSHYNFKIDNLSNPGAKMNEHLASS